MANKKPLNNCQDCEEKYQEALAKIKSNPEKYELTKDLSCLGEETHRLDREVTQGIRGAYHIHQSKTCPSCQEEYWPSNVVGKTVFYKTKDHVCNKKRQNSNSDSLLSKLNLDNSNLQFSERQPFYKNPLVIGCISFAVLSMLGLTIYFLNRNKNKE